MTQPAPSDEEQRNREAAVVAAVAALLDVGASIETARSRVVALLVTLGISAVAVGAALRIVATLPAPAPGPSSAARTATLRAENVYRAYYVLNASRRIQKAIREGRSVERAIADESRYTKQHLLAKANRSATATTIDADARKYGKTLGWYSKMDSRTTEECRYANGRNFEVDRRPPMGYPGAVHTNCRCRSGPPHRTSKNVYDFIPTPATRRTA